MGRKITNFDPMMKDCFCQGNAKLGDNDELIMMRPVSLFSVEKSHGFGKWGKKILGVLLLKFESGCSE